MIVKFPSASKRGLQAVISKVRGQNFRYNLCFGVLMAGVLALGVRLVVLVHTSRADAVRLAERQQRMVLPVPGRPGGIYARAGGAFVPLGISRQIASCYADPALIRQGKLVVTVRKVGEALGVDPLDVRAAIMSRRGGRFVWLARGITADQVEAIRVLQLRAAGITHEWRRDYPSGNVASTVVGFRLRDGTGGGGLELSWDSLLAGRDGKRVLLADAHRRPIWPHAQTTEIPTDGANIFLCLDAVIQGYLQDAVTESVRRFDAQWGAGVVVHPHTGGVLGMCSVPNFDPNEFDRTDPQTHLNRAICCPYEPGSAIKPIFAAAAVDAGLADYRTQIFCENGVYRARRGGRIRDHGQGYGHLPLSDVVVHSSNIGMAKVGEMLGNEKLHAVARRFGLGAKTGVALPGESGGIVRPLGKWDGYSMRRVPFGQEISVTTLQLAMAFSVFANGGVLLEPRIVDFVTDTHGQTVWRSERGVVRRVLRPSVAAATLQVLREVVQRGTGRACRVSGFSSFGKTGTAQVGGPGGYEDGAYVSTFVGGAPADRPRLICVISVYRPDASKGYYGSVVSAPFVKEVLQQGLSYLNVPPEASDLAAAW